MLTQEPALRYSQFPIRCKMLAQTIKVGYANLSPFRATKLVAMTTYLDRKFLAVVTFLSTVLTQQSTLRFVQILTNDRGDIYKKKVTSVKTYKPGGGIAMPGGLITHSDNSRGGRVFSGVCMFVYLHDISKTDAAGITKPDRNVARWVLETNLSWGRRSKVKVMSHNKSVSVFRRNAILPLDASVCHDGVFPAAVPRHTSHASDTGLPRRYFPATDAEATRC